MPMYRFPGPVCLTLNALPPDGGTSALINMPARGSVGTDGGQRSLSEEDQRFIRVHVGRNIGKRIIPLDALRFDHATHVREYAKAVREDGRGSWRARYEQAVLERFEELIADAESPRGKAAEKLKTLLEGPAKATELKKAMAEVLTAEQQLQRSGRSTDGGGESMTLVGEAVQAVLNIMKDALAQAIEAFKRPGSQVSDAYLSKAAEELAGAETDKQVLGLPDDGTGGPGSMELMGKAVTVVHERRLSILKDLIDKKASDEDLMRAIGNALGTEQKLQILGLSRVGEGGEDTMQLISKALEVSHKRHLASLRSMLANAQRPGSTVTRRDIQETVAKALGTEQNREILGTSDPQDEELSTLLSKAAEVVQQRQ